MLFRGRGFAAMIVAMSNALLLVLTKNLWSRAFAILSTIFAILAGDLNPSGIKIGVMAGLLSLALVADYQEHNNNLLWLSMTGCIFS
jgi:hypothetical protein